MAGEEGREEVREDEAGSANTRPHYAEREARALDEPFIKVEHCRGVEKGAADCVENLCIRVNVHVLQGECARLAPWVRIRCHTAVEKLEPIRAETMTMRPMIEESRRTNGQASRT